MKDKHTLIRGLILLTLVLGMIVSTFGCGIDRQFLLDSQRAILNVAGDYLSGCKEVSMAPKLSVDWKGEMHFGGGIFVGCEESGRLAQFYCEMSAEESASSELVCEPLETWEREAD